MLSLVLVPAALLLAALAVTALVDVRRRGLHGVDLRESARTGAAAARRRLQDLVERWGAPSRTPWDGGLGGR